jgi:hypothetical protein
MPITELPIQGGYDQQRFKQYSPEDAANWTLVTAPSGKRETAMYPAMGRRHITYNGSTRLIFAVEPRGIFRSLKYMYYVVGSDIFRVDSAYNTVKISFNVSQGLTELNSISTNVFADYLIAGNLTFVTFVDGVNTYVYQEPTVQPDGTITDTGQFYLITDPNVVDIRPTVVRAFGNRIVINGSNSAFYYISKFNLGGSNFDPDTAFSTEATPPAVGNAIFNTVEGEVRQFTVLNNQLYIFTDFTTEIWSNIPSVFEGGDIPVTFPFKKSTTYNWDYGIADPLSIDTDFQRIVWLAKNQNGLVQVMISDGGQPQKLSTKAIDVLFQKNRTTQELSPFLQGNTNGFLYQFENTIYYRISAGQYKTYKNLDCTLEANSIEFNFDTNKWARVIEDNGARNRIEKHMFFNNVHYVTVQGEDTVYEMSGQFYTNELRNPEQPNPNASDGYIQFPFRYERTTPIIFQPDYSEFITSYVQIDFVFGDSTFTSSLNPFENTVFVVAESVVPGVEPTYLTDEDGNFIIQENTNFPTKDSQIYNNFYKPHVSLYFSDDGGISFNYADNLEFSQLGVYQWRMRWYQLGPSRNRVYKLVCVSPAPIVVLGGVMEVKRSSGGGN